MRGISKPSAKLLNCYFKNNLFVSLLNIFHLILINQFQFPGLQNEWNKPQHDLNFHFSRYHLSFKRYFFRYIFLSRPNKISTGFHSETLFPAIFFPSSSVFFFSSAQFSFQFIFGDWVWRAVLIFGSLVGKIISRYLFGSHNIHGKN